MTSRTATQAACDLSVAAEPTFPPIRTRAELLETARRDWADHGPEDGTVDPLKAGWDYDPNKWRLHYRVRSPVQRNFPMAEQARAAMGEDRWAELDREWEQ